MMCLHCILRWLVLTVDLVQMVISVNESDSNYLACINRSHATLRPVKVEVVDVPGTAQRRRGEDSHTVHRV